MAMNQDAHRLRQIYAPRARGGVLKLVYIVQVPRGHDGCSHSEAQWSLQRQCRHIPQENLWVKLYCVFPNCRP